MLIVAQESDVAHGPPVRTLTFMEWFFALVIVKIRSNGKQSDFIQQKHLR